MKSILLKELNKNINEVIYDIDLFICSASFENRCLSISQNIDRKRIKNSIIFYNEEFQNEIENNLKELSKLLDNNCTIIDISLYNSIFTMNKIKDNIISNNNINSVLIDITTFTHEFLLILIKMIYEFKKHLDIVCVYSGAKSYNDSNKDKNLKWLSQGIKEVHPILGYSGNIDISKDTELVIISGYEYSRAIDIIKELEPNKISIYCTDSKNSTSEDINESELSIYYSNIIKSISTDYDIDEPIKIMANDICYSYKAIINHINNSNNNIIIAPLNNKITTVATGLVGIKKDDVQLCYAPALAYNVEDYSTPGEHCYIFNLTDLFKKM